MKRLVTVSIFPVFFIMLVASVFAAPTAVIKTLGVSDRLVAQDDNDIYTRTSSGLPNVGVGQMVYLAGNPGDTTITGWTWTLTERPRGSSAALSAADQPNVTLTPDVVGTYRVALAVASDSGQSAQVSLAVNSAIYVGVGGIVGDEVHSPQCAFCHNGEINQIVQPWRGTKHARTFVEAVEGRLNRGYGAACVSCHVTGFDDDTLAANSGFDDRARAEGWAFLDSANGGMRAGVWDSMKVHFPQTAAAANVQCENCHGPGSAHRGNLADNKIGRSLDVGVCARCHDSGELRTKPYEWSYSKHSKVTRSPTGPGRGFCVGCHTGYGFVDRMNGLVDSLRRTDYVPITCATCHNPHDATNDHQLRNIDPQVLVTGAEVDFVHGNLCVNCHRARRTYEVDGQRYSRTFGSHNNRQTETLMGTNAYTYGQVIEDSVSVHAEVVEDVCVGCHMHEGPAEGQPGYLKVGGHTFAVDMMEVEEGEEGVDNVAACVRCHRGIEDFEGVIADSDWDGDGAVEAVMAEVDGMMEALAMLLPPVGEPRIVLDSTATAAELRAYWNYRYVDQDGSHGVHNARYVKAILALSLADPELGVERMEDNVPLAYSLKPAYPNPFNSFTTVNYSLPRRGRVSLILFDMAGREVATLFSGEQVAGVYKAAVNLGGRPSGVYLLRMQAGEYTASRKLVLVR